MEPDSSRPRPPKHLQPATRKWFSTVTGEFELEDHHLRLLTLACEAYDRGEMAREAIASHGMTFVDRFGSPRARPEVGIERDARIAFARLLREMDLDAGAPSDSRPPPLRSNRQDNARAT